MPTIRIDPRDIVTAWPGIDAVCECGRGHDCRWPFDPECWGLTETPTDQGGRMKVQLDITVDNRNQAIVALNEVANAIYRGESRGSVEVAAGVVGKFEILEPQEAA